MTKINLKIKGMHCKSCEILISDALLEAGVKECSVDSKKGVAVIEFDENKIKLDTIKSIIKDEGYTLE